MTPSVNDPLIGKLVDNRYLVRERVARGGMATVYRATDKRLGRTVALKIMHAHLAEGTSGQSFVARFRREARAAARVSHPGLVAVFDQGVDGDISYLTLEFVEGSDLRQLLELHGTLSLAEALAITEDILDALAAAHRSNLVHRDVKPENVLLSRDNEVKLTDFGLARAVTEVTSTTTGTILGTVAYLAPELVTNGIGDTRTDIYSVGIMLFEMLVGRQPFVGDAPIHIAFQHINHDVPLLSTEIPWIPLAVEQLVRDFTAKDPSSRPDNATEALRLLKSVQSKVKPGILVKRAAPPSTAEEESARYDSISDEETAEFLAVGATRIGEQEQSESEFDEVVILEHNSNETAFQKVVSHSGNRGEEPTDYGSGVLANNATVSLDVRASTQTVALPLGSEAYQAHRATNATSPEGQVITASGSQNITAFENSTVEPLVPSKKHGRGRRVAVWTVAMVLLATAGFGGWYWWSNIGPGSFEVVPSRIEGVPQQDALDRFTGSSLQVAVTEAHDDSVPLGHVIIAEPASGEKVKKESAVSLIVSLGVLELEVPSKLTGKSISKVQAQLKDAGFSNVIEERTYDTKVKKDVVKALSVKEGAVVPHNSEITVTVSDGPEPITIPQVIAKKKSEALAILETYELKAKSSEEFSDSVPKGQVISQDPAQGTAGHRGDNVSIVLSKGPELIAVPDVTGMKIADAKAQLESLGFKVKENVYLDGFFGLVRFQDVKAGDKAAKGSTISLTVF